MTEERGQRLDTIAKFLSGNGRPRNGLLWRVDSIEEVRLPAIEDRVTSVLRWVRWIGGCIGTCALALVAAVVRYWMNGG